MVIWGGGGEGMIWAACSNFRVGSILRPKFPSFV